MEVMMDSNKLDSASISWGVLGTARTAYKRMLPAMLRSSQKIAAIAGRSAERINHFKDTFTIGSVYDWAEAEKMFADPRINAIYVPLPNSLHAAWVVRALEAGKHVLCEKPIVLNTSEINRIISIASQNKLVVEENFSYYLSPGYRYLQQLISTEDMGSIRSIRIQHSFPATAVHHNRYERALGGGSFLDLGCYAVDFVHRLLDETLEVDEVLALRPSLDQRSWTLDPGPPVDVECKVNAHTPRGVRVEILTSFLTESAQSVEITTNCGDTIKLPQAFRVELSPSEVIRKSTGGKSESQVFVRFDTDLAILDLFADKVSQFQGIILSESLWKRNARTLEDIERLILEKIDKNE
jgi:D-xylose 1-dehydrogenase (NADP+, D-xylono-1,5-lactone-forming)